MPGLAFHHNPSELYRFLVDRVKHAPENKIILVRSQATRRFLSRKLQNELNFFAPRIETLESWLDDLATMSISGDDRPDLILSPDERVLVLEDWLRNHPNDAYRKFAGPQSVQAISNIIADLRRANIPLDRLSKEVDETNFSGTPYFASLLKDYQVFLTENNREDRERLPSLLTEIDSALIPQNEIILYEPNYLFASQKKGLESVIKFCRSKNDKSLTLIQFIPKSTDREDLSHQLISWFRDTAGTVNHLLEDHDEVIRDSQQPSLLANRIHTLPLYTQDWHDPRTELEQTMRQIARGIDSSEAGEHGSRFDDYVILAGDISRYESLAEPLARQYGLPVYCSRGPSLISHPVVRRLINLLQLIPKGFLIDDVYQIFADNQIRLPKLDHDVDSTPNIRSFSQFCRHYNLRTLSEADGQLSSIFDTEKNYAVKRSKENEDYDLQQALEKLEANSLFYQNIIRHLAAFQQKYKTKGINSLGYWIAHAWELLSMPENLFSSEANLIRSKLLDTLTEIHETHKKLKLNPDLDHTGFMDILKLSIEKQREKPEEKPEGILITQAGYFSDTFGKTVFLLGMNEGGFPAVEIMDYLQFRYEEKLSGMLYLAKPDRYLEARLELSRQLSGAAKLYISRPAHISQKKVIGSSLWQDLQSEISQDENGYTSWPSEAVGLSVCQADRQKYKAIHTNCITEDLFHNAQPIHSELIAAITNERENPKKMGFYDGVLEEVEHPDWKFIISQQMEAWWQKHAPDNTIQTSISRLDEFAGSPLDYFFNRVLRLVPAELYRDEAESNIKGTLLHEILEAFYTPDTNFATQHTELVWPKDDIDKATQRIREISDSVLHEYHNQLGYKDSPFPAILKNNIHRAACWFLEQEAKLDDSFSADTGEIRPATMYDHHRFKMEYQWALDRDYGDIKARIIGKIDRVDIDKTAGSAVVYDYKSGTYGTNSFHKVINFGQSFQLPIYGLAVLDQGVYRFGAGYYSLPLGKSKKDVNVKYELGDKTLFDESYFKDKKAISYMGLMDNSQISHFLYQIENLRLSWILRKIRSGGFHVSLTGQPGFSNFKWISRYNKKIQKERAHIEEVNREDNPGYLKRYFAPLQIFDTD